MANRKQRAEFAKETVDIQKQGFYTTYDGAVIQLTDVIKQCNENSRIYTEKDFPTSFAKDVDSITTEFEVTNEYSITACLRLAAELSEHEKVACLNFASAKNPGGGMLNGSLAQEESICLCSCLYSSLEQFHKEFYEISRKDPRDGLYHNMLIYSPDCAILRNDLDYELLANSVPDSPEEYKPVRTSFITCAAVNKGVAKNRGIVETEITKEMLARMELVLRVAAETGHEVLVLGAWGCGVFHNQPRDVAKMFARLLKGGAYANVFRKVVFAVGIEARMDVFRSTFA